MNGVEFCRKVRKSPTLAPTYIILLTGRRQKDEVVAGLEPGANDYMPKPFDRGELHARVRVGERVHRVAICPRKTGKGTSRSAFPG